MPNFLLDPGVAIYAALAVALVVWLGVFAFLWRLDRQARELRRRLDAPTRPDTTAPRAILEPRNPHPPARVATNDK
ncbi:MAG: CcmD family protein [Chloroflexi bacterium SZAS-1]|jgi:CcmD family protein|nr:CcmD family protein [Chloroflexi bacterium SZAS-1]HNP88705.1 CcmD family protein [Kouleothrix sp.]